MPDYKGFDDWIEIFKGGKQTDSNGREHDGNALIDKAVAVFDPKFHEPPVVVGHPMDNAPAYGWVAGLKKEGDRLLAKFKDIVPEFAAVVKQGIYKKRSASFYPDGRLRHVGFLGGAPPAVKGLADMPFAEGDDAATFEFGEVEGVMARVLRRMREWFIEKDGQDAADRIISDWDINTLQEMAMRPEEQPQPMFAEPGQTTDAGVNVGADLFVCPECKTEEKIMAQFTEADLETAKKEAAEETRKKVLAEFTERDRRLAAEARKREIKAFCDTGVAAGKLVPAWIDAGLPAFMESLGVDEISFAEGKKDTALAWFKGFLSDLPKLVDFSEVATRGKDVGAGSAGAKLTDLIQKKRAANKDLSYAAAFSEVQLEHPELAREYAENLGNV